MNGEFDPVKPLDPGILVGRPADEAREIAERHGYVVRVVDRDRGGVTLDLLPGRVHLISDGAQVTDVVFG
jgi:hypothetical protein